MTPAGHQLTTRPVLDQRGRRVFAATCGCMPAGMAWYAPLLGDLYDRHQAHLDALREASRRNHPTARRTP